MKKRFLLTSVLMLLLTVLALSTSTYAWFTITSENYVDEISIVAAESTGGLQISATGDSWGDAHINVNTSNTAYDLTADKTGRIYSRETGSDDNLTDITEENNADVDQYNQFDIYFKTTSYGAIVLDLSESFIVPYAYKDLVKDENDEYVTSSEFVTAAVAKDNALGSTNGWNATTGAAATGDAGETGTIEKFSDSNVATKYNKSTYGDISRDWIAAAFRMSFEVVGYQATTGDDWTGSNNASQPIQFVKALETVTTTKNGLTGKYSVKNTGTGSSNVKGVLPIDNFTTDTTADDNAKNAITADDTTSTPNKIYSYTANELLTTGTVKIAAISDQTEGTGTKASQSSTDLKWEQGKNLIVKVRVRMWIEGQDSEAILPLTAGKIAAGLKFTLDQTGYENPTDYRTVISFSSFSAQADGFSWTIPTAAIEGTNVFIYKDIAALSSTSTLPTDEPIATVAKENKTYVASVAAGTYYIVAQAKIDFNSKTGFKVAGSNYFKVLKTSYTGDAADATETDYDYYVFEKVTYTAGN